MNEHLLENSTLFKGLSSSEVRAILEETPHHVQCYDKSETIFHLMDEAARIGIVLEGCVQAQKSFANGSQVNVTSRFPGQMLGIFRGPRLSLRRHRAAAVDHHDVSA